MKVGVYTSFTFAYLARARVLANTLRANNPDWDIIAVITDRPPQQMAWDETNEPFDRVIWYDELEIPNLLPWLYTHDVVEVCTAVKGHALVRLLDEGYDRVFYLDPDIAVFAPLDTLLEIHQSASVSLTPHQLNPEPTRFGIIDNEIGSLKFGVYNLGYVGVTNDETGRRFAQWWMDRLHDHCFDDVPNGLFTDQRWCDLAPALFPRVAIVRDPGLNVASWNLASRKIHFDKAGNLLANDSILRFFHFTKMGALGRRMTMRHGWASPAVLELWRNYEAWHTRFSPPDLPKNYWFFGRYENEEPIEKRHRVLYRNRQDLQHAFPDPYRVGNGSFHEWLSLANE